MYPVSHPDQQIIQGHGCTYGVTVGISVRKDKNSAGTLVQQILDFRKIVITRIHLFFPFLAFKDKKWMAASKWIYLTFITILQPGDG
jgi:hypothetical protein